MSDYNKTKNNYLSNKANNSGAKKTYIFKLVVIIVYIIRRAYAILYYTVIKNFIIFFNIEYLTMSGI